MPESFDARTSNVQPLERPQRREAFFGSSTMIDCIVHDLTNAGARVEIPIEVDLPDALGLTFDGGYSLQPCRIVWRKETETGVKFL